MPEDHIMEATGELQNPKEVLSKVELQRYKKDRDFPLLLKFHQLIDFLA